MIASGEKVRVSQTMAKYDWKDPLNLNSLLTEEERSVRDAVRTYCQEKLLPRVTKAFRNESNTYFLYSPEMGANP